MGEEILQESENEFTRLKKSAGADETPVLSTVPSRHASQPVELTHLFGPEAFVSLGAAIKTPSAWKCGITEELLQGPVAGTFSERLATQAVTQTNYIVTHSSNASLFRPVSGV